MISITIKKNSLYVFLIVSLSIILVGANLWLGTDPLGFIDSFDRPNNDDLGNDWADTANTNDTNASIINGFLKITDKGGGQGVSIVANTTSTNSNNTYNQLEFRINVTGVVNAIDNSFGVNVDGVGGSPFSIKINDSNLFLTGRNVLTGTDNFSISKDIFYEVLLKVNWSHNKTEWFVNDVGIGNKTFITNVTDGQDIILTSGTNANKGNLTFDYIQWGTQDDNEIIRLIEPIDNFNTALTNVDFSCNITSTNFDFTNISLYVDDVRNFTNSSTANNVSLTRNVRGLTLASHTWTCIAYNSSADGFSSPANRSFNIVEFVENSQTFNLTTIEGATETFIINVTWNNDTYDNIQGRLFYNNTLFNSVEIGDGNNVRFSRSITIDSVDAQEEIDFIWEMVLTNSTDTVRKNATGKTQTVNNINVDDCSSNTILLLNYSLKDEETQVVFNATE